jgi:ketosteroid isomerase-like protein
MSQENVETVRRLYDAAARRDSAAVLALYDPDVEVDNSRGLFGEVTGGRVYRGHEELLRGFHDLFEVWEGWENVCEELIDAGDQVISVSSARGRGRTSGLEVEWKEEAGIWTVREGRIVRVVWFPSRAEALEAAGLSE